MMKKTTILVIILGLTILATPLSSVADLHSGDITETPFSQPLKGDDTIRTSSPDTHASRETESHAVIVQKISSLGAKPSATTKVAATDIVDYSVDLNVSTALTITGTLKGDGGDKWDGENVTLIRPGYNNITDLTDSNGVFSFPLTYNSSEVGLHQYSVYFAGGASLFGLPPARTARFAQNGTILVTDTVEVKNVVLSGSNTKFVNEGYSYSLEFKFSDGANLVPTSQIKIYNASDLNPSSIQITYKEEYEDENGSTTNVAIDQATELSTTTSFSASPLVVASSTGSQTIGLNVSLVLNVSNTGYLSKYLTFVNVDQSYDKLFAIKSSYVLNSFFYAVTTSNTKEITSANQLSESFFRNGTDIKINGTLQNSGAGPVDNKIITIFMQYAPVYASLTSIATVTTDLSGNFVYSVDLNTTFFTSVTDSVTIRIQIEQLQGMTSSERISQRSVLLRANLTTLSLTSSLPDTSTAYLSTESSFTVTGNVKYDTTVNAPGVDIEAQLVGGANPVTLSGTTNSNGDFSITFSGSEFTQLDTGIGVFSVIVNVVNETSPSGRFFDPLDLSVNAGNFNISLTISLSISTNILGGAFVNGQVVDVLNMTFDSTLKNVNSKWVITVTDDAGRIPLGFDINWKEELSFQGGAFTTLTSPSFTIGISETNPVDFTIQGNTSALVDATPLLYYGTEYKYSFHITNPQGTTVSSVLTETYQLFGPDNDAPTLDQGSLDVVGDDGTTGTDITVTISIGAGTQLDNVKNVTIYYRYSDQNHLNDSSDATFTSAYNITAMTNNNDGTFTFIISFRNANDHGRWVEFYFIIYDRAGQGIDANGNTVAPGTYSFPDPNFSNSTQLVISQLYVMGDITPPDVNGNEIKNAIDFGNNAYVCLDLICTPLGVFDGNIPAGINVTIELRNVQDVSGILNVTLEYRNRTVSPIDGTPTSSFQTYTVLMVLENGIYRYNIGIIGYNVEYDFKIIVTDNIGNTDSSSFASEAFPGEQKSIIVLDETSPDELLNGIQTATGEDVIGRGFPNSAPPVYEVWTNETVTISYNLTDLGLGLQELVITIIIRDADTLEIVDQRTITVSYFGELEVTYTIDLTSADLLNNTFVEWSGTLTDLANNTFTVNSAGVSLLVYAPPQPDEPIDTGQTVITTTDENGNVIVSTLQDAPTRNNGALIFIYSMIGFAILVAINRYNWLKSKLEDYQREKLVRGTMESRIDQIKKLGAEGDYKKAVILIWKAMQTLGAEALQAPQKYNQTVRDYINIVERVSSISSEILEELAFTFEKAKYGNDPITIDDYNSSLEALNVAIETVIETGVRSQVDDDEDWSDLEFDEE